MTVYEGVLESFSGGETISTAEKTPGYVTFNMNMARYHQGLRDSQAGWMRRHFVDVGGTRITNVILSPYYDELLQEAVGQEIGLSVKTDSQTRDKRNTVIAIRTPKAGVVRPTRKELSGGMVRMTIGRIVNSVILMVLLAVIALVVGDLVARVLFPVGLVVAIGLGLWYLSYPYRTYRRVVTLATALDGPAG